ncbi:MAG: GNAT family N-acetyltransferase [Candidatus Krumholzibacteria bacterium]|nr:GNAT family N-acetyltransferase [Candidatus Krumholzibacteria bacterium]
MTADGRELTWREMVRPEDAGAVRRIVSSTGFFSPEEIEIAVELVEERLARGDGSGYHFIFAERGSRPVGYACFGPIPATRFSWDLYWIAVDESDRGGGIGRLLLERSERIIARMGGRRIYAETSGRAQYEPTRAFYRACGYAEEAVLAEFYAPGDAKHFFVKEI